MFLFFLIFVYELYMIYIMDDVNLKGGLGWVKYIIKIEVDRLLRSSIFFVLTESWLKNNVDVEFIY